MTDSAEFLRAGDIACLTGTSVRTVRRWIAEEILPSVKVRGTRLVARKDLERVLFPAGPDWDGLGRKNGLITGVSDPRIEITVIGAASRSFIARLPSDRGA